MEWIERASKGVGPDRLAQAYEEVVKERPDSPAAYLKLADLCLKQGDSERALQLFQTLAEIDSSNDSLILAKLTRFVENDRTHAGAQKILARASGKESVEEIGDRCRRKYKGSQDCTQFIGKQEKDNQHRYGADPVQG